MDKTKLLKIKSEREKNLERIKIIFYQLQGQIALLDELVGMEDKDGK